MGACFWASGLLAASALLGCASTVDGDGRRADGGADARVDRPAADREAPDARVDAGFFDTNTYDIYRDPPCPGARPPPRRDYACEPLGQQGCQPGESCYPFIEYPTERCGVETYRAQCFAAGTSGQGDFCRGGTECLSGYACFVTGAMNRCLRLCRLDGTEPRCGRGQVCEPTDLPDFGACN